MGNKQSGTAKPPSKALPAIIAQTKADANLKNVKSVYNQGSVVLTLSEALPTGSTKIGLYTPKSAMFVPITNGGICSLLGFSTFNASTDPNSPSVYITSLLPGVNTAILLTFASPPATEKVTADSVSKAQLVKKNVYIAPSASPVSATIASIVSNTANGLPANAILVGIRFGSNIPPELLSKNMSATSVPDSTTPIEAFTVGGIDIPFLPDKFDMSNDSGNYRMYLFLVIILIVILYYMYKNKQSSEPLTLTNF